MRSSCKQSQLNQQLGLKTEGGSNEEKHCSGKRRVCPLAACYICYSASLWAVRVPQFRVSPKLWVNNRSWHVLYYWRRSGYCPYHFCVFSTFRVLPTDHRWKSSKTSASHAGSERCRHDMLAESFSSRSPIMKVAPIN
jgi:hypothetical protein